jgi:hypothetical protein
MKWPEPGYRGSGGSKKIITLHAATSKGFRFSSRAFKPRPLDLGWARSWGSRVGIGQPALSKGKANGKFSTAARAWRARRRREQCHVKVHSPPVAAPETGLPLKQLKAQRGA